VQLGYVANAFCYLVERATGHSWQMEKLAPLGLGLTIAPSSLQGTTLWQRGGDRLEVQALATGWQIAMDVRLQGQHLTANLTLQAEEALALVHPLAPGRIAYTHKAAGMPAHGTLTWAGETLDVQGLATLDWTRSQALRTTRWKWCSLVHVLADGRRLGLNLSAEVYDGPDGVSQENAAWLDGSVHPLGIAQFQVPADPQREAWRITGPEVDLTFRPMGARQQDVRLGLISSRFVQPFGLFTGSLTISGQRLTIAGAFGVVEDHLARW
jgi:predicted secreted hydrolase